MDACRYSAHAASLSGAPSGIPGWSQLVRQSLAAARRPLGAFSLLGIFKGRLWQAGRKGKWKAVRYGIVGGMELYDLESDPQEDRDVSSLHPELVLEFDKWFKTEHIPSPHWPVR